MYPTAKVIDYIAPTASERCARVVVSCPLCVKRDRWRRLTEEPLSHTHGVGIAGGRPTLDIRSAHCGRDWPRLDYELVDPDGLVPDVLEVAPVDLSVEVTS